MKVKNMKRQHSKLPKTRYAEDELDPDDLAEVIWDFYEKNWLHNDLEHELRKYDFEEDGTTEEEFLDSIHDSVLSFRNNDFTMFVENQLEAGEDTLERYIENPELLTDNELRNDRKLKKLLAFWIDWQIDDAVDSFLKMLDED